MTFFMYLMCLSLHPGYIEMLPALFLVYVLLLQMDDRLLSRHDLAPHDAVLYFLITSSLFHTVAAFMNVSKVFLPSSVISI